MSPLEETYLDMAKAFESQGNYERALVWFKKIQDSGDVYEIIGEYLYLGRGCGKDVGEARKYFEKAAELGNADALCNLALCEKSPEQKLALYKKSAESGNAYAMNMAGIISEELESAGSSEAVQWFRRSAEEGSEIGCYNYAMNTEDADEKMRFLALASEKDCIMAMEKYAEYLTDGTFGIKDPEKAALIREKIKRLQTQTANDISVHSP